MSCTLKQELRCIIGAILNDGDEFLEGSFSDALGKLTGFETVLLRLTCNYSGSDGVPKRVPRLRFVAYKDLDEYLSATLGPGEGRYFDASGAYCLNYHPRGRATRRVVDLG